MVVRRGVGHVLQPTSCLYLTIYYTRAAKRCGDLKISFSDLIRDRVHTGIVRYPPLIKKISTLEGRSKCF